MMEYKKLTGEGFPSCITKIVIVLGLVLTVFMWFILFFGLYTLNNEITLLKAEHEKLISKILNRHEYGSGYSTEQDFYEYYDTPAFIENEDENPEDFHILYDDANVLTGDIRTKDGLDRTRQKRDIVGRTVDGIPVNSESYAEVKRKNRTKAKDPYYTSLQANYGSSEQTEKPGEATVATLTSSPVIYSRKSRVMHNNPKRKSRRRLIKQPMLRSFKSNSPDQVVSPDMTVVQGLPHRRRHRQRRVGSSLMLRPAIHMNGEVSSSHTNYENHLGSVNIATNISFRSLLNATSGNGRMHHYNNHFKNWTKDNWVENLGMDDYFQLNDGYLRFLDSGLYYIYAQIYYVDEHDTNGFGVYKNDEIVLQCTTTSHTTHRVTKPNSCYTGGVVAISNGDIIKVHDIEGNRYSLFQKGKSFFGAIKLG
ncbi:hypothetical protein AMK59_7095, partial [Oryctes borbonicus]